MFIPEKPTGRLNRRLSYISPHERSQRVPHQFQGYFKTEAAVLSDHFARGHADRHQLNRRHVRHRWRPRGTVSRRS